MGTGSSSSTAARLRRRRIRGVRSAHPARWEIWIWTPSGPTSFVFTSSSPTRSIVGEQALARGPSGCEPLRRHVPLEFCRMLIATHRGSFHADDVFAVAALRLLGEPVEVVRTRDRDALAQADVRVDVGFRDDATTGDFDHHQRDFDRARANGVRYASFGLVWREFGARICDGDQHVADAVDETLVQPVDANDTGQRLTQSLIDGARPMTISGIVGGFNPR